MFSIKQRTPRFAILLISLLCFIQAGAQIGVEAELAYSKLADNTVSIAATLADIEEYDPVIETEIAFFSRLDTEENFLGNATTDEEGKLVLEGVPFSKLLLDSAHRFYISYTIPDSTSYLAGDEVLSFQDVGIKLTFEEIDSVKQIVVQISSWDEGGEEIFIEELDAYLFVPRLFSMLPIGEIYTEEEGIGMTPFPTDLPGGKQGEITLFVQIQDSDEYGNVEIANKTNWALPSNGESAGVPRALWSPRPPMWMVITFALLMIGVWFHYGWIVLNMFRIKAGTSETDEINYEL